MLIHVSNNSETSEGMEAGDVSEYCRFSVQSAVREHEVVL